jgi:hypothetical protein
MYALLEFFTAQFSVTFLELIVLPGAYIAFAM